MNNNSAFTAGVRFGGLSDRTEIKILVCYLLSNVGKPVSSQQIIDTLVGQELVNYFELQDALSHLTEQNLIYEENGLYHITNDGVDISKQLEKVLPYSVRERAYKSVISLLQYDALKKQNQTSISPNNNGGYTLNCKIADDNFVVFSCDIHMPNEKSAIVAKENFIKYGHEIFKCVLGIIIENPNMYKHFLEQTKDNL